MKFHADHGLSLSIVLTFEQTSQNKERKLFSCNCIYMILYIRAAGRVQQSSVTQIMKVVGLVV